MRLFAYWLDSRNSSNPVMRLAGDLVSHFIVFLGVGFMAINDYLLFEFERRSGIIGYNRETAIMFPTFA